MLEFFGFNVKVKQHYEEAVTELQQEVLANETAALNEYLLYKADFDALTPVDTTDDFAFLMKWQTDTIGADIQAQINAIEKSGSAVYDNSRQLKYGDSA